MPANDFFTFLHSGTEGVERNRVRRTQRELVAAFAEKNPQLMQDLGIPPELLRQASMRDLETLTRTRQSGLEARNSQQAFQQFLGGDATASPDVSTGAPIRPTAVRPLTPQGTVTPPDDAGVVPPTQFNVIPNVPGVDIKQSRESQIEQDLFKAREGAKIELDKTMKSTTGKELSEAYGKAGRMIQAIRTLSGLGTAMDEDFPGGGGPGAFVTGGAAGFPLAPGQLQDFARPVLAYNAQLQETKIAAVPILSGQARYVVDLANAIAETVPDASRIGPLRKDLLAQTTRNMLALTFGIQNGALTAENLTKLGIDPGKTLNKTEATNLLNSGETPLRREDAEALLSTIELTPSQEEAIEKAVNYVLETPAIRRGTITERSKVPKSKRGLLRRYKQRYPNRTDEEIIRAMKKAGEL